MSRTSDDPIGDKLWLLSMNMQEKGGSFVKALGVALLAGDGYNQTLFYTLLCHNWPDYVQKYRTWPFASVEHYEQEKGPSTPPDSGSLAKGDYPPYTGPEPRPAQ
jgi:hypothetical protein